MATAQEFVNALRTGNYIQALKFYDYVREKYSKIKNPGQDVNIIFDDDDLNQCSVYELLKTNLNRNDLPALNYLVKCIESINSIKGGLIGKKMGAFTYASSMLCAFQANEAALPLQNVTNAFEFDAFMDANSPFSKAISNQRDNKDIYSDVIYSEAFLEPFNNLEVERKVHHQFFSQLTHPEFIQYIDNHLIGSRMSDEQKTLLLPITLSLQRLTLKSQNLNTRGYHKEANILSGFTNHMRLAIWQIVRNSNIETIENISERSEALLKFARDSSLKHQRGLLKYVESALNTFTLGINLLISKLRGRPTLKTRTLKDIEASVHAIRLFKKNYMEARPFLEVLQDNNQDNII